MDCIGDCGECAVDLKQLDCILCVLCESISRSERVNFKYVARSLSMSWSTFLRFNGSHRRASLRFNSPFSCRPAGTKPNHKSVYRGRGRHKKLVDKATTDHRQRTLAVLLLLCFSLRITSSCRRTVKIIVGPVVWFATVSVWVKYRAPSFENEEVENRTTGPKKSEPRSVLCAFDCYKQRKEHSSPVHTKRIAIFFWHIRAAPWLLFIHQLWIVSTEQLSKNNIPGPVRFFFLCKFCKNLLTRDLPNW